MRRNVLQAGSQQVAISHFDLRQSISFRDFQRFQKHLDVYIFSCPLKRGHCKSELISIPERMPSAASFCWKSGLLWEYIFTCLLNKPPERCSSRRPNSFLLRNFRIRLSQPREGTGNKLHQRGLRNLAYEFILSFVK